jgi:hypothetical protein
VPLLAQVDSKLKWGEKSERFILSSTLVIDSLNVCSSYSEVGTSLIKAKVLNLRERGRGRKRKRERERERERERVRMGERESHHKTTTR